MSAGPFVLSKYQLDGGMIVPIRIQPETMAATSGGQANDEPDGAITLSLRARARKGNREYGIGARSITISWTSAPPQGYNNGNLSIPILTSEVFELYSVGDAVTYLGTGATIVGKRAESLR